MNDSESTGETLTSTDLDLTDEEIKAENDEVLEQTVKFRQFMQQTDQEIEFKMCNQYQGYAQQLLPLIYNIQDEDSKGEK